MPTKYFLTTQTAPYTPATIRGAWADTGGAVTRQLSALKKSGGIITTVARAETSASNPRSVLLYRGVSGPLAAQTLSGTLDVLLGVIESNTAADMCYHLYAYITTGDSDTVRGTIVSDYLEATSNEWGTSAATSGRALAAAQAISLAISDGDRLVVEIGYAARNSVTTSYTGTLHYGTQLSTDGSEAPDLTAGGSATVSSGFILFSNNITEFLTDTEVRESQGMLKLLDEYDPDIRMTQDMLKMISAYQRTIRGTNIMLKVLRSPEPPDPPVTESRKHNPMIGCWI